MSHKQTMAKVATLIRKRVPGVVVSIDAPSRDSGTWFVDVHDGRQSVTVEFRPKLGVFGLSSTPGHGYGEGSDECEPTADLLVQRIAHLFRTGGRTVPHGGRREAVVRAQSADHRRR